MDETLSIFSAIALAIVLEALPFLALGALLSAIIEVFVSPARFARIVPRRFGGQVLAGLAGGLVVPTCECGVVPVSRRLLLKGVPAPTVVAYMLSAPILNPVVLASTFVAFRGSWALVGARAGVAVVVASTVAFLLRKSAPADLVRRQASDDPDACHAHDGTGGQGRFAALWLHAAHDFLDMGKYLILGALVAAAFKTYVPPSFLAVFEGNLVLSISGMMLLAIILSVCSEADAFVAASFVTFPAAAHLAFVAIGPMVDIKLLGLYAVTFRKRTVGLVLVVPLVLVFLLSLLFGMLT